MYVYVCVCVCVSQVTEQKGFMCSKKGLLYHMVVMFAQVHIIGCSGNLCMYRGLAEKKEPSHLFEFVGSQFFDSKTILSGECVIKLVALQHDT